ncbi:hypothetical protein [Streptomyces physcomitrii]|uniref:Uncharacterized protein n=1 Tax=Streptomyces physcomitrii TaxID=2724184 RepID=A0ABX1H3G9_9ACTN|nr:hypothetical protein [Streptomyces physcomitrii]NKI42902.1 hypothetical protein [Streptomyces physcomitrii]
MTPPRDPGPARAFDRAPRTRARRPYRPAPGGDRVLRLPCRPAPGGDRVLRLAYQTTPRGDRALRRRLRRGLPGGDPASTARPLGAASALRLPRPASARVRVVSVAGCETGLTRALFARGGSVAVPPEAR